MGLELEILRINVSRESKSRAKNWQGWQGPALKFRLEEICENTTHYNNIDMGISKKGADPSRAERKAKKRKLEDAIPDLPGDNETTQGLDVPSGKSEKASKKRKRDNDGLETATNGAISEKERKAAKEAKKEQKRLKDEEDITAEDVEDAKKVAKKDKKSKKDAKIDPANINTTLEVVESEMITKDESVPRKSKKERKAERKAKEAAEVASTEAALLTPSEPAPEFNGDATLEEKKPKRNNRNRERKRKASGDEATNGEGTAPRFIVFIGTVHAFS